jgi:plastocyanin
VASKVRVAVTFAVIGCLGVLAAFALPRPGGAANPQLIGTVGPGFTITLTDSNGVPVTSIAPGTYDIEVTDYADIHNFHLFGPGNVDEKTTVSGTGQFSWTVTLVPGTYTFQCDPHAASGMRGTFTVTGSGTTSTATTGTSTGSTSTATTTQPTTTTAPTTTTVPTTTTIITVPKKAVRCVVPRVVGRQLARARRMIVRARCRTGRISRRFSHARRGRVIAQRPRAGVRRPVGTRVNLVVSRGRRR